MQISGFKSVILRKSNYNKGLAQSVIEGVSEVLSTHKNIIVLEDDLITSRNFLNYMNQSLNYYEKYQSILSVTGFTLPIIFDKKYNSDIYFSYRHSSWGWAIWKDRWLQIDWELAYSENFINDRKIQKKFNIGGNDLSRMLKIQILGKIDSWAIRFCYYQFRSNKLTVAPIKSKIKNMQILNKIKWIIKKMSFPNKGKKIRNLMLLHNIKIDSHRFVSQRALSLICEGWEERLA
jgi:hypothetical protein